MKHIKLFEQFINESLNEKDSWDVFRQYFSNPQNPETTIHDKISSYSNKVSLTTLIDDLMKDLNIPYNEEKKFKDLIKKYIKYNDVTGKLKKSVNINENKDFYADNVLIKVVKNKKVGNDYHIESEFKFKDKKTLDLFMDNELDDMNGDILDWAENEFNIDGADYAVNPSNMKAKGTDLIGTLKLEFVK